MGTKIDIAGRRFGRLVAIRESASRNDRPFWLCRCDCGAEKEVAKPELTRRNNAVLSCGCFRAENLHTYHRSHGMCGTVVYKRWKGMFIRTKDTHKKKNSCYIGKSVCKRWHKFENFLADMGEPPPGYTLERINNRKGYSPSNCKWATWTEQMNNHSGVRRLAFRGKTQSMKAWADELGLKYSTLANRLNVSKWPIEKAFSTPLI